MSKSCNGNEFFKKEGINCLCQWTITAINPDTGEIVNQVKSHNIITKLGRGLMLACLFGLPMASSLPAMAVGDDDTAATVDDDRLGNELLGNATRIQLGSTASTSSSFVALGDSDVIDDPQTIGGIDYEKSITVRAIYPKTDGNNGSTMQEFALATTLTLPAISTDQSGWIFNHYVLSPGTGIPKTAAIEVDVDTKLLF